MNVELLYHTPNPQKAIAVSARLCYSSVGASELNNSLQEYEIEKLLNIILQNGHYSALEHASYTFSIEGISRAASHQLVRHRLASYNQQSQRYVGFENGFNFVEPKSIKNNSEALKYFVSIMKDIDDAYKSLIKIGIPKEDARYILPNATETKIIVTMNARELLHFFSLRCCNRAQWEIRELSWKMLNLVEKTAPIIFHNACPSCISGVCNEGKMSCKNPYQPKNIN